ncbi:hypothetical protein [Microbacterium sp. T32]|uniref:hypothetical protein n=1 Tax=Microbacterium sp. T32 TaxID=1776083 RepID=UPI0007AB2865|nr:hypothetical protein [Microbacterium sp. T32]KZE42321.1 hypothetical protein AVW09_10480 [Microbacterium sp. T32]
MLVTRYGDVMPWRTYWPALALSVPVGSAVGALCGALVFAAGLNWGSALALISTGAVGGAVNAVFAAVGGLIAVAMVTRRGGTRVIGAAVGGAAAAAAAAVASAACAVLMSGARFLDRRLGRRSLTPEP